MDKTKQSNYYIIDGVEVSFEILCAMSTESKKVRYYDSLGICHEGYVHISATTDKLQFRYTDNRAIDVTSSQLYWHWEERGATVW